MMKKKIVSKMAAALMMALVMTTPLQALAAEEEVVNTQSTGEIQLTLTSDQQTPQYSYGETKDLNLQLKNSGTEDVTGVAIVPNIEAGTGAWPFEIENKDYRLEIGEIKAGQSVPVTYTLQARGDVASQYYKVGFTIFYNQDEAQQSQQQGVYIKTKAKPADPAPTPTPTPAPTPASDPTPAPGSANSDGAYQGSGEDRGVALAAAGGISNSEPANASVPRVIVTGFRTEPGEVTAGSNFRLVIKVKNTSGSTQVKNMTVGFSAPTEGKDENSAPAFLPSAGANTLYIDQIAAGAEREITMDLNAKQDLVQKPYSLDLAMKYEDKGSTQYDSSSSVAIPIKQAARFEFSKIEVNPESVAVGDEANVTANLYNLGKVKLYNVKVRIEGKSITAAESFLGNVDSGATANIDLMAKGEKETKTPEKIKMIMTYEDSDGKVSKNEQEFSLSVTAPVETTAEPVAKDTEKKAFPVIPVVVGILVAAGGGFALFKKIRKGKEELEDEMDGPFEDE